METLASQFFLQKNTWPRVIRITLDLKIYGTNHKGLRRQVQVSGVPYPRPPGVLYVCIHLQINKYFQNYGTPNRCCILCDTWYTRRAKDLYTIGESSLVEHSAFVIQISEFRSILLRNIVTFTSNISFWVLDMIWFYLRYSLYKWTGQD